MTEFRPPSPACLFVALLHRPVDTQPCLEELIKLFGPISHTSLAFSMVDFSSYYEKEMGAHLQKQFVAFAQPAPMENLADYKLATHALEKKWANSDGKRTFNIDPGLATGYSVILSTLKNHSHRIYLRDGVFAEVTLIFRNEQYHPLPWTYPDYQSPLAQEFFTKIRPRAQ